jgi:peptidoglycan/xylan/chitin deacetylase (PgdA/CDA1 family)
VAPASKVPAVRAGSRAVGYAGAGLAALFAAGGVAHAAPAAVAWRRARNLLMPNLSGAGDPGHVALTFDDGPDPESTPSFLQILDELGWKATFFLTGAQVRRHPELAAEVAGRGHELGVHGDVHSNHLLRTTSWTTRDAAASLGLVEAVWGMRPVWFRPPYGALAASSLVAARRLGLRTVLWTTWAHDWKPGATAESVVGRVEASWWPGATVLLHDSDATSAPGSWKATLGALPVLAERWAAAGLRVGPLGEHGLGAMRSADQASSRLSTLPVALRGSSSRNSTSRGTL